MPAFIKCLGNSVLTLRQTYSRWSPLLQLFQLFKHLLQGMLFYENLDCYLYSSKLPYIWISPATHLTADLKCCSSSSISCSTHGRLQSWRPCCPCSWSGAFSWIYCTPVPRLLQYMLHCLLSLPMSSLQRYLHLDQPSINWPNICCSAYSWIYCTPVLLLLPQYRLHSLLLNYHRLQVLLPLKHPLQYRLSLQSWCSCCLYS